MNKRVGGIISDLPNEVLNHIISLLPPQSVAESRLLSSRWRDLLNVQLEHGRIRVTASKILGILPSPVNGRWMGASDNPCNLEFDSRDSRRLLVATLGAQKGKLHIDFSIGHLPDISVWLTCLHLMLTYLPSSTEVPIRSIHLTSVGLLYCDVVSSLLSNLKLVESVEIRNSQALTDVSIFGHVKLRHVSIVDCLRVESIHIFADTLTSLRCRGRCPVVFISAPCCFTDIMLDFRQGPADRSTDRPIKYLLWNTSYIAKAQYITLCQWTFEVLMRPTLPFYQYQWLKDLWWIDSCMKQVNIDSLITFLRFFPTLQKLYVTIDPKCYRLPRNNIHESHDGGNEDHMPLGDGKLHYLEMVKMDGFENEEDAMLLADRIFSIAKKELPTVVATLRNSGTMRLVIVNPNHMEFVEETDSHMLNAKHIHMSI